MGKPDRPEVPIEAIFSDVDGVWTDGGMYFDQVGQAMKRFNVKDGYVVAPLQRAGVAMVWVTADDSAITRARARKLGVECVCTGVEDKGEYMRETLQSRDLGPEQVIYIGDDLSDLSAMEQVGIGACPADAARQVIEAADWVTERAGGRGAVREICDQVLQWNDELRQEGNK